MITTAIHSEPIDLGRQGENLARTIEIDISAWRAEYGEGTVQLLHQRPGDSTPYPAAVEQAGDVVRWEITAADTARVGYGAAQLLFYAGDVLAKQCIYRTYVSPSLGQSAGEPPEAQQPWVERVLAEAAKVTGMTARAVELPAGADPTADYADGILTIGIPLGDVSEAQVTQAVADYLATHPVNEIDPTVPDWAKQPGKPSYTADEVGAIAQTELQAAIDTALAQAKASGAFDGDPGPQGAQGETGPKGPKGDTGETGPQGETGVGIQSVVQTTESTEDGGTNVITVTKTDGTSSTFSVRNGSTGPAGADGKDGATGADGQDGTTPTIGDNGNWFIGDTDTGKPSRGEIGPAGADGTTGADGKSAYQFAVEGGYTGTKAEFAAKLAQEKYANPNALTFSGAVTGSYDGSVPITVNIPDGGSVSGGCTFLLATETTEEVSAVNWSLPINWDKIIQLNIYADVPSQDADLALYAYFGGTYYKSIGTLTAGVKNGIDMYILRTSSDFCTIGTAIVKSYPENAKPVMPTQVINMQSGQNTLRLYSNTSGVNFPVGTKFVIWGVYVHENP